MIKDIIKEVSWLQGCECNIEESVLHESKSSGVYQYSLEIDLGDTSSISVLSYKAKLEKLAEHMTLQGYLPCNFTFTEIWRSYHHVTKCQYASGGIQLNLCFQQISTVKVNSSLFGKQAVAEGMSLLLRAEKILRSNSLKNVETDPLEQLKIKKYYHEERGCVSSVYQYSVKLTHMKDIPKYLNVLSKLSNPEVPLTAIYLEPIKKPLTLTTEPIEAEIPKGEFVDDIGMLTCTIL